MVTITTVQGGGWGLSGWVVLGRYIGNQKYPGTWTKKCQLKTKTFSLLVKFFGRKFSGEEKKECFKIWQNLRQREKKVSTIFLRPLKSHLSKKFKSFLHLLENEQFDFIVAPERGRKGERGREGGIDCEGKRERGRGRGRESTLIYLTFHEAI